MQPQVMQLQDRKIKHHGSSLVRIGTFRNLQSSAEKNENTSLYPPPFTAIKRIQIANHMLLTKQKKRVLLPLFVAKSGGDGTF